MGKQHLKKSEIENQIADFLKTKGEIMLAYIFGSFVQNNYYHDIDVAVYLREDFDRKDFPNGSLREKKHPYGYESSMIGELSSLTKMNIDFVVMNNATILIQQRIINKGMRLFSRDESFRIQYENRIRKLYIDYQHLWNIQRYYLSKHIDELTKRTDNA